MEIKEGMPATEHWVTDSCGHVVTRVSATSIWTRRVAHGESVVLRMNGPWPVTRAEGLLDQPEGPEYRWTRRVSVLGNEYATRGTGGNRITLTLGESYRVVDYSF